jgi:hypothetical protein
MGVAMEATIKIRFTTSIISSSEIPSGRLVLFALGPCVRRRFDSILKATHHEPKHNFEAAVVNPPVCPSPTGTRLAAHMKANLGPNRRQILVSA